MYVVRITPADIGSRVSIRHRVGAGPVLSDVVGALVDWSGGVLRVRTERGLEVAIAERDVVAGKTVPPRPMRRNSRAGRAGADGENGENLENREEGR